MRNTKSLSLSELLNFAESIKLYFASLLSNFYSMETQFDGRLRDERFRSDDSLDRHAKEWQSAAVMSTTISRLLECQ